MLTQLCKYLRNWFVRDTLSDDFTIASGEIVAHHSHLSDFLQEGQYFRIVGSVFNDGVHQYGQSDLTDELSFTGILYAMAIPKEVISLDAEIDQWIADNAGAINSPYQSESFGGYSYSKGSNANAAGSSAAVTWQGQFASALAQWRKLT